MKVTTADHKKEAVINLIIPSKFTSKNKRKNPPKRQANKRELNRKVLIRNFNL